MISGKMTSIGKLLRDKYYVSGALLVIGYIFYVGILALGSLEGAPKSRYAGPFFPYLTDKPLTEDGYYMLTVAWNIAEGKGFTYNRGIQTTGVQPLATLVYSVPAYIVQSFKGDKYDFARAVIILSALLQVVFAFLIYRIASAITKNTDKGLYFLISVCVVLFNFKVLLNFANGLETGSYLVLLSSYLLYWLRIDSIQNIKQLAIAGIFTGLLLLCRLDSLVILITFYLLIAFTSRIKIYQIALILIIALIIYLPWQIYVMEVTESILQSSAQSQTGFLSYFDKVYQSEQYLSSIIHHLTPFLYTGNIRLWLMFPLGILYLLIVLFLVKKFKIKIFLPETLNIIRPFFFSIIISLIVFFVFSTAPYFYFRYLVFILVLSLPVGVIILSSILTRVSKRLQILFLLIVLLIFGLQAYLYFHSGKSALTITMRPAFIQEHFDESKLIGAFQTGALGYYVDNVVNLDGKMNIAALQSSKVGIIEQYIDSEGIDVLIEWDDAFMWILDSTYLANKWEVYSMDIGDGRTRCYVRQGFNH